MQQFKINNFREYCTLCVTFNVIYFYWHRISNLENRTAKNETLVFHYATTRNLLRIRIFYSLTIQEVPRNICSSCTKLSPNYQSCPHNHHHKTRSLWKIIPYSGYLIWRFDQRSTKFRYSTFQRENTLTLFILYTKDILPRVVHITFSPPSPRWG